MAKVIFTKEEIEAFRNNQYVVSISEKSISFSEAFKEILVREGHNGQPHRKILRDLGIDARVLGTERVKSLFARVRIQATRLESFKRTKPLGRPKKANFTSIEEENRYLKDRMDYLEQENEFLKKLAALERGEKNKYAPKKNSK
jgi:putative transposase